MALAIVHRVLQMRLRIRYGVKGPCSQLEMSRLNRAAMSEYDVSLPTEYLEFLSLCNGLEWDGAQIFASERNYDVRGRMMEGILEANKDRFIDPNHHKYFAFGGTGDEFFCRRIDNSEYVIVAISGLSEYECFDSFEAMLDHVFSSRMMTEEEIAEEEAALEEDED